MVKGLVGRFATWLIALAIIAGGVVLGVLQVRWVGEASRAEEIRLRASLNRGAEQVRSHAEEEIRVLLSLARVSSDAVSSGLFDSVEETVRLWFANTRFPGLLRNLYVVRRLPADRVVAWSREAQGFVEAELPSELAGAIPAALAGAQSFGTWPTAVLADWRRLILLPVYDRAAGRLPAQPTAAVVVDLDARVFYGEVVPCFMDRSLAEFPWRILDTADGTVIGESEALDADRQPEAVVGLRSLAVTSVFQREVPQPSPSAGTTSLYDPLLQSWLQRSQGGGETAAPPQRELPAESAPGKAWVRRTLCESVTETLRRNPAGQPRPAKAGDQPEPSVAWHGGNPGREAYTGSVRAV